MSIPRLQAVTLNVTPHPESDHHPNPGAPPTRYSTTLGAQEYVIMPLDKCPRPLSDQTLKDHFVSFFPRMSLPRVYPWLIYEFRRPEALEAFLEYVDEWNRKKIAMGGIVVDDFDLQCTRTGYGGYRLVTIDARGPVFDYVFPLNEVTVTFELRCCPNWHPEYESEAAAREREPDVEIKN